MSDLQPSGKPPHKNGAQLALYPLLGALAYLLPATLDNLEGGVLRFALVAASLVLVSALVRWLR